jgi:precorrin-2/cobalt-factor-2 C20-methyltransferase
MTAFYEAASTTVAARLDRGVSVALLCEGDPFFYGSAMYLFDRLSPRYAHEVVPGITGMSGAWARAGVPMTHGDDVLTVLPGTLDGADLALRLRDTDAAVIMKVGRNLPKIRRALAEAGRAAHALYVERGTMAGERIAPLADIEDGPAPYFSLVLVPGRRGAR